MATEQTKVGESAEQAHKLRQLIENANLQQASAYEQADNLDKISQAIHAESDAGRQITDDDRRDVVELADQTMGERENRIGGNDPSTRAINATPERRHSAAMSVASAVANQDAEANNTFQHEELRKIYDRERQHKAFLEKRRDAEREQEQATSTDADLKVPSAETVNEATEDRRLELSEAAREQFDRYQRQEIEYSKIKETKELEEGYEINRLVAHSRLQQDRLAKGEITPDELAKDEEAREGRELDESIEKARARRIEQEEERGEIEAEKANQNKEAEGSNQIQDFDAMAATQARHNMPEDVERDFPRHKAGDARTHYYGKDPDRVAFVDKGDKMQTPRDFDQQGVRAMVDIAKARGWEEVKVRGSESFRRQVYLEAAKRGIEVKGYKPTEAEQKVAERDSRNYKRNQEAADAFRDAGTREEKAEAAEKHGQLAKAYAIERSLQAWERKNNIPEANRVKLEKNLHDMIEKDLRDGKNLASVRVRNRKQEHQVQRQEEAEQVR